MAGNADGLGAALRIWTMDEPAGVSLNGFTGDDAGVLMTFAGRPDANGANQVFIGLSPRQVLQLITRLKLFQPAMLELVMNGQGGRSFPGDATLEKRD